jgi:hypothetical protein
MSPNDYMDFLKIGIIGLAILIPIAGFTARFALRPIADAMIRLRGAAEPQQMLEQRMGRLEAEVDRLADLRGSVERLTEELEFNRKLAIPAGDPPSASEALRA